MSAVDDAAILYIAVNGWGAELACAHVGDDELGLDVSEYCQKPMVGINSGDGCPLCAEHVKHPGEDGHVLSGEVLEAIRVRRRAHIIAAGETP